MRQIGLIILLFFTSLAYAQNVEFKASAPSVVAVGEQFKLEYTLNKEGDNLKVPTLEGFDLLMGPSVGQSFYSSNINGKMTQNVTFSYTYILEGTKKGTFQIPGATVIIDGKEYTSNALKIEVVIQTVIRRRQTGRCSRMPMLRSMTITCSLKSRSVGVACIWEKV